VIVATIYTPDGSLSKEYETSPGEVLQEIADLFKGADANHDIPPDFNVVITLRLA